MLRAALDSRALFRLALALPAVAILWGFFRTHYSFGQLIGDSGEWSARLLIATLAITPVRLLLRQIGLSPQWPMWLFKRRRDLGIAAFLYALLHLGAYVVRQSNINVILYDLPYKEYLTGWIASAAMLLLAVTSNDWAVHAMGTSWKLLQRLSYLAAATLYLHWLWIRLDHWPAYVHFLPLVLLEAYRLWHDFARPGARHRTE